MLRISMRPGMEDFEMKSDLGAAEARRTMVRAVVAMMLGTGAFAAEKPSDPKYWIDFGRHLIDDVPLRAQDGALHAVVEIPAGDHEKWETDIVTGRMFHDHKDAKPRSIGYAVPYPANYGSLPQTLMSKEIGGDGDPLDFVLLGERRKRGDVVAVRVVALLRMVDTGDLDNKVIVVPAEGRLSAVDSLEALAKASPGVDQILQLFFTGYKLNDQVKVRDSLPAADARALVESAHGEWRKARASARR
jgi:inorganic pyrophosphatase